MCLFLLYYVIYPVRDIDRVTHLSMIAMSLRRKLGGIDNDNDFHAFALALLGEGNKVDTSEYPYRPYEMVHFDLLLGS